MLGFPYMVCSSFIISNLIIIMNYIIIATFQTWTFSEESGDWPSKPEFTKAWGSGYPGDPVTKKFLQDNLNPVFGFPSLIRFSWKTAEKILQERGVKVEFEEVEPEEEENVKKNPSVKDFFVQLPTKKGKSSKGIRKHPYFNERGLHSTTSF